MTIAGIGGVQGSIVESLAPATYQNDGGVPGDAPDTCGLAGPVVQASDDEHDLMGQLVPADDAIDHWVLAVSDEQVGQPVPLRISDHGPEATATLGLQVTVLPASCDAVVAEASMCAGCALVLEFVPPEAGSYVVAIDLDQRLDGSTGPDELLGASPDSDHCTPACAVDYVLELLSEPPIP